MVLLSLNEPNHPLQDHPLRSGPVSAGASAAQGASDPADPAATRLLHPSNSSRRPRRPVLSGHPQDHPTSSFTPLSASTSTPAPRHLSSNFSVNSFAGVPADQHNEPAHQRIIIAHHTNKHRLLHRSAPPFGSETGIVGWSHDLGVTDQPAHRLPTLPSKQPLDPLTAAVYEQHRLQPTRILETTDNENIVAVLQASGLTDHAGQNPQSTATPSRITTVEAYTTPMDQIFPDKLSTEQPNRPSHVSRTPARPPLGQHTAPPERQDATSRILPDARVSVHEVEDLRQHAAGMYIVETATTRTLTPTTNPSPSPLTNSKRQEISEPASAHQDLSSFVAEHPTPTDSVLRVKRSIADFAWLEQSLRTQYDSVIVPTLPPMALVGRLMYGYAYEFERRRGLEKFLQRLIAHPVLASSEQVTAFVGAQDDDAWSNVRKDLSHHHQSVITSTIFGRRMPGDQDIDAVQWFSKWTAYKLWQAGRRINRGIGFFLERDNPADLNRTTSVEAPEARLRRLKEYINELGASLAVVRRAATKSSVSRADHVRCDDALNHAMISLGAKERGLFGRLLMGVVIVRPLQESVGSQPSPPSSPVPPTTSTVASTTAAGDSNLLSGSSAVPGRSTEVHGVGETPQAASTERSEHGMIASATTERDILYMLASTKAEDELTEVLRDFEQRSKGAKRIMGARLAEQEAYEHALEVYTKLRDRVEARTGSMWRTDPNDSSGMNYGGGTTGMEELYDSVSRAEAALSEARRQYKDVAVATTMELRRLRKELHAQAASAICAIARDNARHHAARSAAWSAIADRCDAYMTDARRPTGPRADVFPS